jgi:glycosyltransferase involved in cell wall biosynthesis
MKSLKKNTKKEPYITSVTDYRPLVSCLCVTENRHAFMPWLLWCFDRQTWARRELVIIDSSDEPSKINNRSDIRVIPVAPETGVAKKRSCAIQEARGEILTWFDDDDWQHPKKLDWLVDGLGDDMPYTGTNRGWFVDLAKRRCASYCAPNGQMIFNSGGFRRDAVANIGFRENIQRASDTHWMRRLMRFHGKCGRIQNREDMFFWLCHDHNLSNPAKRRRFPHQLEQLKRLIGPGAWGDTDDALEALCSRLNAWAAPKKQKSVGAGMNQQKDSEVLDSGVKVVTDVDLPPVSVMIKATVMDAPYLGVMVPHMIGQAKYPFAERVIVVDRNPGFKGKYRSRPRTSEAELGEVLSALLADKVVDRVLDVDMNATTIQKINARYFGNMARSVPTHDVPGGPIYPTLFGLESMDNDHVLQMDGDVFFYTLGESWVKKGLRHILHDEQTWLMMTHPGPPTGRTGASLGPRNARVASWDAKNSIWRFPTATTRYFLCDRRRLHGRLRPIFRGAECIPLEQCISRALQDNRAFRGALGDLSSWHLHAWYHGDPFPKWVKALAKAIESGAYPAIQGGEYDLRLDKQQHRREWLRVLQRLGLDQQVETKHSLGFKSTVENVVAQPRTARRRAQVAKVNRIKYHNSTGPEQSVSLKQGEIVLPNEGKAPLAVVIPIRDRAGRCLQNALHSLTWQSTGSPQQIFVVSHGSCVGINEELSVSCNEVGAALLTIGSPEQPWNKPLALNVGIRATSSKVPFIVVMDADMILAPDFLEVVVSRLKRDPPALVLCRISDLPKHVVLPNSSAELLESFDYLRRQTTLRPHYGTGAVQAAVRSFFFEVRGYDEDFKWWGAMDGDMVQRAKLAGLQIEWIEDRTAMLHQWHPRKYMVLNDYGKITQAREAWDNNHKLLRERARTLLRNPNEWGIG